ncbi:hypothetical protein MPDQ_000302 [Monascus purpureus]|uniref:Transcription factor domain-containing protein n=1 Tax=Monascus purpureus TaxID=5098 RepID=A0A507QRW7_MONPU|nr:hypothetical protein MPDQ_000302 [Monascus purpureus]
MAAPLQFFKPNFQSLKRHHPLLFAACLLAGIQTTSVLRGSALHSSLYRSVRDNLGRTMLNTPIELSTIHTMLVFCVWNVAQDFRGRYVDNWFLSGSALLHLLLVLDFRSINHIDCAGDLPVHVQVQEGLRTWTLALYSIGTGQPLVIDISLMERLVSLMQRAETEVDSLEETSTAELQLYILLYKTVVQKEDDSTSMERTWESIEAWAKKHNKDNMPDLKLAYSSTSLILARWDLAHRASSADTTNNIIILRLINQAIYHSHQILEQMMHPDRAPSYVHQTYNTLLRAYAGVTLVEYGVYLPDIQGTFRLMERVLCCPAQEERLVEPVFQWATNVMRKRALDAMHCSVEVDEQQLAGGGGDASAPDWTRHFLVDAMFPFN